MQVPAAAADDKVQPVIDAVVGTGIPAAEAPVVTAIGGNKIRVQTQTLTPDQAQTVRAAVAKTVGAQVGNVRGFAYMLGLYTVIDIVVVFLFTKPVVTLLARTRFFGEGHPLSGLSPARLGVRPGMLAGGRPGRRRVTGQASAAVEEG